MNILLVDDEELEVAILKQMIDTERLFVSNIYTAYSKKQAMALFRKYPISIMVCDIEMPKGSGHELTRWVRDNHYETEVIYLTGHASFDYATTALRLGAVDYLLKPVEREAFLEALLKAAARLPKEETAPQGSLVERIQAYIRGNCEKPMTRQEIAEKFYIHPDSMSRLFREQAGISFKEYVIKTRVERAKKKLCYTDESISRVAASVGYADTAYFAKHFKRETGMTPKEYRKNARGTTEREMTLKEEWGDD